MKKKNIKTKGMVGVILPTISVIALAISLPLTLSNLLNKELDNKVNNVAIKQLSNNTIKTNNDCLANDGSTNLLPSGSQIVTLPNWYSNAPNPTNWSGVAQKQLLNSNQYSCPSTVDLNVYNPTTIEAMISIPKEYVESSNFSLNFYWTFLGNSKSLGILKNTDDANIENRNGLGTTLPNSWVTNTLYKTPSNQYTLKSKLVIPKEYAPYFYNEHQSGNWKGMNLNTVKQYFNFVLTQGQSQNISTFTTSSSLNYVSKNQYVINVESAGISSKSAIEFTQNLQSNTDYINGQPLKLTVSPYNINVGETNSGIYSYKYQWFLNNKLIKNSATSVLSNINFSGADTNTLVINNPDNSLNGASIYCKVIGPNLDLGYDGQNNSLKGEQSISGSSVPIFTNSNITTLTQLTDFNISSVNLSVTSPNTNSQSSAIVPQGQSITLSANAIINPVYDKYLKYTWYFNKKVISNQSNSTLVLNNVSSSNSGSYYCQVSLNWNGKVIKTVQSNTKSITVVPANNFSIQLAFQAGNGQTNYPSSQDENISIYSNTSVQMYAVPYLGGQPMFGNNQVTYQWYKDGIAIADNSNNQPNNFFGANTNQLQNAQALPNSSGAFTCVATYKYPTGQTITATSNTIYLNVQSMNAISIYQNLHNVSVKNGETVTLELGASLNGNSSLYNLNYTWQYKAPNSNNWITFNPNYLTPNKVVLNKQQTLAANGYTFQCQVSTVGANQWQTLYATSNTATISVVTPNIKILSNPISIANAKIGSSQSLSVEAVIDNGNNNYSTEGLNYQWCTVDSKNKITAIKGATQQTYTISKITSNDNNTQYMCYVYPSGVVNPENSGKYSSVAMITVLQPSVIPSSLTIYGNTNLMIGQSTTLSVKPQLNYDTLPSGYSLKYQWYKSDNKNDTFIAIQNANTNSVAINDVNESQDNTMYWCEVSVMNGNTIVNSTKSRPAILNVDNLDSISIQLPSSIKTYVGGNATINAKVTIDGKPPIVNENISYQWKVAKPSSSSKTLVWEDVAQANSLTLNLSNVQLNQNGYMYALQVNVGSGSFVSNFPTTLEVFNSSYVVNLDSTNVIVNEKQTATIKANVTQIFSTNNTNFKYQWYVIPKGTQPQKDQTGNYTNGQIISAATNSTLTLSDSLSTWDGAQFYCQVSLDKQVQTSQIATLQVKEANITANPLPYRVVANNGSASIQIDNVKTSFDINGASLKYQWQKCTDGKNWIDISGANTTTLSLSKLKTANNGDGYRVVVTYSDANTVYETYTSNPTTLIVNSNVNVMIQLPSSINAKIGSTLTISPKVEITGTNINNDIPMYQWQKFDTSKNEWVNQGSNSKNVDLSLPIIQSTNNGDKYRLVVSVAENTFTSDPVSIIACQNSFTVKTSTDNVSTIIGGNISASVSVQQLVGSTPDTFTYQWYAQIDGQEPALIKKQTTSTLSLMNAQKNWNNAKFYCVVTDTNTGESLQSSSITLNINEVDILNTELPSQVLSENGTATFQIKNATTNYQIDNTQLTYQWFVANPGSNEWTKVDGATSNTLTLSDLTSKDNGKLYKCLISYGKYATEYSNASILTVNSSINVDIQMPNSINGAVNQNVVIDPKIQISANNLGSYKTIYQWQESKNNSSNATWTNITGATNEQLTLNKVQKNQSGTYYRLVVTVNGNTFTSNSIQLMVYDTPFVVNIPNDQIKVNIGSNAQLSVIVSQLTKLNKTPTFTYKWYVVQNGVSDPSKNYVELPDKYNSANITLDNVQSTWNNAKFYCVVSDGTTSVSSSAITLLINNNTITYDQLPPIVVANNSKAIIVLQNVKPGYTIDGQKLQFIWQVNDGKNGWQNWVQQTQQTLNLGNLTYLQNGYSFRCQISYANTIVTTNATTLIVDATANVNINLPDEVNASVGGSIQLKPTISITGNNINPQDAKYQWQYSYISPSGEYKWANVSNGNQQNLTVTNLNYGQNGFVYRLSVQIAGQTYTSSVVRLNVYSSPFVINANKTEEQVQIGGDLSIFTYIVQNYETDDNEYTYQWYATKDLKSINSATKINGQTNNELQLDNISQNWNNWYFFCVAEQNGIKQRTQLVQLQVIPDSIQVSELPSTIVVENSSAVIEIKTATPQYVIKGAEIKYQWQIYKNGTWQNLENQTNNALALTNLDSTANGAIYRCQVTYSLGSTIYATTYSNPTSLVVNSTINVTVNLPEFINTFVSANVNIEPNIKIDGTNLGDSKPIYQWQIYDSSSKKWTNVSSNGNNEEYSLTNITKKQDGQQYRISITLNGLVFNSNSTTLKVYDSSFAVNVSQQNITTNIGQQFEVSVNVNQTIGSDDTFTYQWYVLADKSSSPVEIQGATQSTLVLKNPQMSWNNAKFYCVVSSVNNKIVQQSQNINLTINPCTLNVPNLPTISVVKNNAININLGEVTPNYEIANAQITYQWQKYNTKTQQWENVSQQTNNSLSLSSLNYTNNGDMYRCQISYSDYAVAYSSPTTLVVNTNWTVNVQVPNEVNTSINQNATLTPTVNIKGENVGDDCLKNAQYQWQVKTSNGQWINVDENGNNQTLKLTNVQQNMNKNQYRLIIKIGGNSFTSNEITLNVFNSLFTVNTDKTLISTDIGQDQLLTLNIQNSYDNSLGNYTYQWYYVLKNSNETANSQGVKIENATNATLRLTNPQLTWSGLQFYCAVTANNETHNSPLITLSINPDSIYIPELNPTVVSQKGQATIKVSGVQPSYTIKDAVFQYQWFQLVDGKWNEIQNQTSDTLKLNQLTSEDNGNTYRCVVSYTNGSDVVYSSQTTNDVTLIVNANANVQIKVPNQINVIKGGELKIEPIVNIDSNASNDQITYQWQNISNESLNSDNPVWQNIDGQTNKVLDIKNIQENQNGFSYRLLVNVAGSIFTSNNILVNVLSSAFVVNSPSTNYVANAGTNITLSVNVSSTVTENSSSNNISYKYQWYYADPIYAGGSENATDEQIYKNGFEITGQTNSTLLLKDLNYSFDNLKFFCKVTQVNGEKQTTLNSPVISIHVNKLGINMVESPSIVFAKDSSATLMVKGLEPSYTINGAMFKYQWYRLSEGQKEELYGQTNSTLVLKGLTSSSNGSIYVCQVSYVKGDNVYDIAWTSPTSVVVNTTMNVDIYVPDVITVPVGSTITFKPEINISGDNLGEVNSHYQWQYVDPKTIKPNSKEEDWNWQEINDYSGKVQDFTIPKATKEIDGYIFRLEINLLGNTFISNPIHLEVVNSGFAVNSNKKEISLGIGQTGSISVDVTQIIKNDQNPKYTYQWYVITNDSQIKPDGSLNGNLIEGATNPVLRIENIKESWNDARFYCVVKQGEQVATSPLIKLNVKPVVVSANNLPIFVNVSNGKTQLSLSNISTNYSIANTQFTYQWQKLNVDNQWIDIPLQTNPTLNLHGLTQKNNGDVYRCKVSYGNYALMYTSPTTLIVNSIMNVSVELPSQINGLLNGNLTIKPEVNINGENLDTSNIQYQWRVAKDTNTYALNFSDIDTPNGKQAQLVLNNLSENQNNNWYQLVVTLNGNSFTSNPIQLHVLDSTFVVNVNESDVKANLGEDISISAKVDTLVNDGSSNYKYQWYVIPSSSNNRYSSYAISNSDSLNGTIIPNATDSTLNIKGVDSQMNNVRFYCEVSLGDEKQYSTPVELEVNQCYIYFNSLPITYYVKNGKAILEVQGVSTNYEIENAKFTYQWQMSSDNGKTWINIENETSPKLELDNLTDKNNGYSYRCVINYGSYVTQSTDPTVMIVQPQTSPIIPPSHGDGEGNINNSSHSRPSVWIAIPIVFGSIAAIGGGLAIWWFIKKRNSRWGN